MSVAQMVLVLVIFAIFRGGLVVPVTVRGCCWDDGGVAGASGSTGWINTIDLTLLGWD